MGETFDPLEFLEKLNRGAFDGHLHEEFAKLTYDQLEQLADLITRYVEDHRQGAE